MSLILAGDIYIIEFSPPGVPIQNNDCIGDTEMYEALHYYAFARRHLRIIHWRQWLEVTNFHRR